MQLIMTVRVRLLEYAYEHVYEHVYIIASVCLLDVMYVNDAPLIHYCEC